MSADSALLSAQATGGIDGANAYIEAQQEVARRKKAAVEAALAEASGRGAPAAAMGSIANATGESYDMAGLNMAQQAADYTADMARRTSRWNEYAHNVESARSLVDTIAGDQGKLIDAQTKAQLALLQAQRRSSGGGGGGGGGGSSKFTVNELKKALADKATAEVASKANTEGVRTRQITRGMGEVALNKNRIELAAKSSERAKMPFTDWLNKNYLQPVQKSMDLTKRAADYDQRAKDMEFNPDAGLYTKQSQQAMAREAARLRMIAKKSTPQAAALLNRATGDKSLEEKYDSQLKDTVPPELRRSLSSTIANAKDQLDGAVRQRATLLNDPRVIQEAMNRIAMNDPMFANVEVKDLIEATTPSYNVGESLADYLNRTSGGPTDAEAARANEQAAKDAAQADFNAMSQQIGMDIEQLASSANMKPEQVYTMLNQDKMLNAALADAAQAEQAAADDAEFQESLFQIRRQLDPVQRAVFDAYTGY